MKRLLKSLLLAVAAVAVLAIARTAEAQNITITASVPERCQISATADIAFAATYDGFTDLDEVGSVTTRCTRGTTYTISITEGNNPGAGFRQMAGQGAAAGELLRYDLYQDAGYTTPWRFATPYAPPQSPNNSPQVHTVYARIPLGQDPLVGDYQDVVTVSVTL